MHLSTYGLCLEEGSSKQTRYLLISDIFNSFVHRVPFGVRLCTCKPPQTPLVGNYWTCSCCRPNLRISSLKLTLSLKPLWTSALFFCFLPLVKLFSLRNALLRVLHWVVLLFSLLRVKCQKIK